jgi:hypothetical protein
MHIFLRCWKSLYAHARTHSLTICHTRAPLHTHTHTHERAIPHTRETQLRTLHTQTHARARLNSRSRTLIRTHRAHVPTQSKRIDTANHEHTNTAHPVPAVQPMIARPARRRSETVFDADDSDDGGRDDHRQAGSHLPGLTSGVKLGRWSKSAAGLHSSRWLVWDARARACVDAWVSVARVGAYQ